LKNRKKQKIKKITMTRPMLITMKLGVYMHTNINCRNYSLSAICTCGCGWRF